MLYPALPDIFFRKNDALDPRLGECVNSHLQGKQDHPAHRFSLFGVPDDRGVLANSGRPGAHKAPDKIREQFYKLPQFTQAPFALFDKGNLVLTDSLEQDHASLAQHVQDELALGATCIIVGGGNDYAFSDALALSRHEKNINHVGLINLDAHLDVRDLRYGITSGTPFYRVLENLPPLLTPKNFIEFACQGRVNSAHYVSYLKRKEVPMYWLESLRIEGIVPTFHRALKDLASRCPSIGVTLDMDVVAQAFAPGVSAPSPNGLAPWDLETICRVAGSIPQVRVFSVYEVNPEYDQDSMTSRLAASCLWNFIDARLS